MRNLSPCETHEQQEKLISLLYNSNDLSIKLYQQLVYSYNTWYETRYVITAAHKLQVPHRRVGQVTNFGHLEMQSSAREHDSAAQRSSTHLVFDAGSPF